MKVPLIHSTFHYVNLRMFPSLLFPQGLVIIYVQANRNLVDQASQPFHGHMLLEAILEIIHMQLSYQQVEAHANARAFFLQLAVQIMKFVHPFLLLSMEFLISCHTFYRF
ncbi:hypothetical protein GLYMA_01G222551v4 [Glycine max]|nr:hypothetical protein GLYMA_01G222551v4 [Glycine max]